MTGPHPDGPEIIELIHECCERPVRQEAWTKFHALYYHFIQLLVGAAARTVPVQDREDLCQKVWIRMPSILKKYDPERGTLESLLRLVTRHTVTSEWRRSRRERELSQPAHEALWEYVQESPEQQSPALLRTLIMDFLVNNVSDHKKLRIYEDWIEGRSYEEIMQIHSVSRAVVFRRFQECRRLVRWVLGIRPKKSALRETDPSRNE
jgi:RNA polymerase sigma factor (sigma-70 family)